MIPSPEDVILMRLNVLANIAMKAANGLALTSFALLLLSGAAWLSATTALRLADLVGRLWRWTHSLERAQALILTLGSIMMLIAGAAVLTRAR